MQIKIPTASEGRGIIGNSVGIFNVANTLSIKSASDTRPSQAKGHLQQITKDTILAIAKASCINLTEKEVEQHLADFNTILDAFSKIKEVDTKNVQPAFHPIEISDVMREDIAKEGCGQENALSMSKHTSNGCFVGPKIL